MIHVLFFYALLLLACGYAGVRGGAPERAVAAVLLGGTVATWAVAIAPRGYFAEFFRGVELGVMAVDAVMLAALVTIALHADRFWPLWLSALQAFGIVGHLAKAIAPDILPDVYLTAHAFSAYPGLILLICATRWHQLRLRELGRDKSWSSFWPRSTRRWRMRRPTGFSPPSAP